MRDTEGILELIDTVGHGFEGVVKVVESLLVRIRSMAQNSSICLKGRKSLLHREIVLREEVLHRILDGLPEGLDRVVGVVVNLSLELVEEFLGDGAGHIHLEEAASIAARARVCAIRAGSLDTLIVRFRQSVIARSLEVKFARTPSRELGME